MTAATGRSMQCRIHTILQDGRCRRKAKAPVLAVLHQSNRAACRTVPNVGSGSQARQTGQGNAHPSSPPLSGDGRTEVI